MTAKDIGEDMCQVLVGYDHSAAGIEALAVERKGVSETVTKWVIGKITRLDAAGRPSPLDRTRKRQLWP